MDSRNVICQFSVKDIIQSRVKLFSYLQCLLCVGQSSAVSARSSRCTDRWITENSECYISDRLLVTVFLSRQSGNQCSLPRLGCTDDRLNICRVKTN